MNVPFRAALAATLLLLTTLPGWLFAAASPAGDARD